MVLEVPRAVRNVKTAIIKTLANEEKLTWLQILERTGLSKGALSKHLNELIDDGTIKTSTVSSRPPTTVYSLTERAHAKPNFEPILFHTVEEYETFIFAAAASAFQTGILISYLENRDLARDVLKGYLNSNLRWITSTILYTMMMADSYSKGYMKGVKNSRLSRLLIRKKGKDVYTEKIRKELHKLVEPWIEAVANTVFVNRDIAYEDLAKGAVIEIGRNLVEQVNVDWFDVLMKSLK